MLKKVFELMFDLPSDNRWGIPTIKREDFKVDEVIGFNSAKSSVLDYDKTVHFFLSDHEFEAVWSFPDRYLPKLVKFNGCFSPDFSIFRDHPLSVQLFNVFRSRFIGWHWQQQGIRVIPAVGWSTEESYEFCFEGIEKKSQVALSTRGVARDTIAMKFFEKGYSKMLERLEPKVINIYGAGERLKNKFDFGSKAIWLPYDQLHY